MAKQIPTKALFEGLSGVGGGGTIFGREFMLEFRTKGDKSNI